MTIAAIIYRAATCNMGDATEQDGINYRTWAEKEITKQYPEDLKMFAHSFSTKAQKFVIISNSFQPVGMRIQVSGKAEARKVAAANNAKPWNF